MVVSIMVGVDITTLTMPAGAGIMVGDGVMAGDGIPGFIIHIGVLPMDMVAIMAILIIMVIITTHTMVEMESHITILDVGAA